MKFQNLPSRPWHLILAFPYPYINNWVMNYSVAWLGSSDPLMRVLGVTIGVCVSAGLIVGACRFLAKRPTLWVGVLTGLIGFTYYYIYYPEQTVLLLLFSVARDWPSVANMMIIVLLPVLFGVAAHRMSNSFRDLEME